MLFLKQVEQQCENIDFSNLLHLSIATPITVLPVFPIEYPVLFYHSVYSLIKKHDFRAKGQLE